MILNHLNKTNQKINDDSSSVNDESLIRPNSSSSEDSSLSRAILNDANSSVVSCIKA